MRKQIFKIGTRVAMGFAILVVLFVVVSFCVIDRGQPVIAPQELKTNSPGGEEQRRTDTLALALQR